MAVSVTMPRLGESVTEGTVTRWLKKEGDRVEVDEPLLEVSTDKVDTEIPSPAAGIVSSIKVQEDETVEVGVELAVISDGDEGAAPAAEAPAAEAPAAEAPAAEAPAAEAPAAEAPAAEAPAAEAPAPAPAAAEVAPTAQIPEPVTQAAAAEPTPAPPAPAAPAAATAPVAQAPAPAASHSDEAAYVTPLVRKLAAEHGVDLSTLQGTGVGGRIRKQDVLEAAGQGQGTPQPSAAEAPAPAAAPPAPAQPAPTAAPQAPADPGAPAQPAPAAASPAPVSTTPRGTTEPLSRLRKVIAARMVESLQVSAQLTTVVEADVTAIAKLRQQAKGEFEAREGVKLSFLPFFTLAAIEALKAHPMVNASIDVSAGTVTYHEDVNLGIAVDTDRGLLVPVIHGAGDLNLSGVARKISDLADRTRGNKIEPDELGGGTFTLTNTGSRGALFDTPIINQPQVGILGTGAVVKRPVVVSDPDLGEVVAVRSMVYLALTYDHRIVDGADAARFLVTVKTRLEEGDFAAELGL